jgi:uncharacterized membrane protein YcfT
MRTNPVARRNPRRDVDLPGPLPYRPLNLRGERRTLGEQQRIDWLDVAKGFSILGVVAYHANLAAGSLGYDPAWFPAINSFLQPVRMPLFFTIAGVLAAGAIARPWPNLLARKVWLYAYLFGLWGLIRWVYFGYLVENVRNSSEGTDPIQLLTMWVQPASALWFIWALAIYFVIAKLADRFRMLALVAAFALACLNWGGLLPLRGNHWNAANYLFFFLLGAYRGQDLLALVPRRPLVIGAIALALFLAIAFVALPNVERGLVGGTVRTLESVVGLLAGCAGACLAARLPPVRRAMGYLGRHTLPIYVAHVLFISALAAWLQPVAGSEAWRYLIVPLAIAVSVCGTLLLEAAANRFGLPWLYRPPAPGPRPEPATT